MTKTGFNKCKELISLLTESEITEINEIDLRKRIAMEIGSSKLTQGRYIGYLIWFGFIKKLEGDKYAVISIQSKEDNGSDISKIHRD